MAPAGGVVEQVNVVLACADLLRLVEDSAWLFCKKGYTGPSRADRSPDPPYFTINGQREVSTTSPCFHLFQTKTWIDVGSDGNWRL
jgi:hypothetical protein